MERSSQATARAEPQSAHLVDGKYAFEDLVDLVRLRAIFEQYSKSSGLAVGLVNHSDSKLLLETGWAEICRDFHRTCPASEEACKESNFALTKQLTELNPIAIHPCRNGLIDGATPIVIKGVHLADLYVGQVLFAEPDEGFFRQLAENYNYDTDAYLAALEKVQVIDEEVFRNTLDFMREMAILLGEVGLVHLQIRDSKERHQQLMNRTQEPIVVVQDMQYSYVNPAFCRLLGFERPSQAIGRPITDLIHPDFVERVHQHHAARLAGDAKAPSIYEIKMLHQNGQELWIEVSAETAEYSGQPAVQASLHNITERVLAEKRINAANEALAHLNEELNATVEELHAANEELNATNEELAKSQQKLQKSEEHFRSLIENAADCVVILNAAGEITYASPAFERLTGYAVEEILGHSAFDAIHPEDIAKAHKQFLTVQEIPDDIRDIEFRYQHKNGSWRRFAAVGHNLLQHPHVKGVVTNFRDVTERYQAEERLTQTQLQLSSILGSLPDVVFYETGGGRELISKNVTDLLGFPSEKFSQDRAFFPSLIHPDDQESLRKAIAAWHKSGDQGVLTLEFRCSRADGTTIWLEDRMVRLTPEGSKPYLAGVLLDVTERKQAEESIRNSEQQYRSTIDSFGDSVHVVDADLSIVLHNKALSDWHKSLDLVPHAEGRNLRDIYKFLPDCVWDEYRQVFESGKPLVTEENTQLGGKLYTMEVRKIPVLEQGRVVRVITILRNISERRKAEDAIRDSERKYRTLVDSMSEGIAVTDQNECFTFSNPAADRIFGVEPNGLISRNLSEFTDQLSFETIIAETKKRREGDIGAYEINIIRPDGKQRSVRISACPMHDDGEYSGSFGLIEDITERKQLTKQLIRDQKEESMLTLAGGIAHDFNNILMGVLGSASLLRDSYHVDGESAELCSTIITASQRMVDLTNKLLAYARGGRHQPHPMKVDEAINDSMVMLRGSIPDNISVNMDIADNLWAVEADAGQLHQVLMNLIINAAEAMPDGGKLKISARNEHRLSAWTCSVHPTHPAGKYVFIEITDNGIGIPSDTLARIFEPFFSTKFQGRGLGLAAAQGIILAHNGCLHAHSTPGEGTSFHIYLPATDKPVDVRPADDSITGECTETILLVDDEEIVRLTACRMLRRQGFNVLVAADGLDGLETFREYASEIDMVIFDMSMPQLSGLEFYRRLREIDSDVKAIAASGYSKAIALEAMDTSSLGAFVQKPFSFKDLIRQVRKVLDE